MRRWLGLLLVALTVGCGSGGGTSEQDTAIRIALNWFPEHEHGGYFAAAAGGLYHAEGLDVELLPGGPGAPVIARVASGEVEFGVVNADDVVLARAAGAPLVALLAPIQTNPWCIMVHRQSGIERLADLHDLTLAMQTTSAQYEFLRRHVPLTNVTVVPYGGSIAEFLLRPAFAQQAYVISEPILAESKGADVRCLLLADLGFNPYASVLITRDQLRSDQPAMVHAVTRASAAGWARYLDDPTAAHGAILAMNPEIGQATLAAGQRALAPLVRTPAGIGSMTRERWATLVTQLREIVGIENELDPTTLFADD